ncbi:conserved hypothetical protein, membrane [Candidatus Omnitrophus magneticus]|uniref:Uncharacterized protein n=1 Tax=Candidatus Omnitrophus magneticus TaxID=1609969 RepID=A0A0F0CQK3_9BACT|nr:conserved hypothetical protein, membrane [Candidatus Omnitrophus magneticus]
MNWLNKYKIFLKFVAINIALIFFWESVLPNAFGEENTTQIIKNSISSSIEFSPHTSTISSDTQGIDKNKIENNSLFANLTLPHDIGIIKDKFKGQSEKIIVHIQDAHCNYYAQKKIMEILEYFKNEYGINTINLEGGAGNYDLSIFKKIIDEPIRSKTLEYFIKTGEINGAEAFAVQNPETKLWGAENPELYIRNFKTYRAFLKEKDTALKRVLELTRALNLLKSELFSPELKEISNKYSEYKSEKITFKDYIIFLIDSARKNGLTLSIFPNIKKLSKTLEIENSIDFKKAESERDNLIHFLDTHISINEREELTLNLIKFKMKQFTQNLFYSYILNKAKDIDAPLTEFPMFLKYVDYLTIYEEIDKDKIMEEMTAIETSIKKKLFQNENQERLDEFGRAAILINGLFSLSLTRVDYDYYTSNKEKFQIDNFRKYLEKISAETGLKLDINNGINELDKDTKKMEKFFEYAFQRDSAFCKNIKFQKINEQTNCAILITGGFHADNLLKILRRKNISYISIHPEFTVETGYISPYFDLLDGKNKNTRTQAKLFPVISKYFILQIANRLNPILSKMTYGETNNYAFKGAVIIQSIIETGKKVVLSAEDGKRVLETFGENNEEEILSIEKLLALIGDRKAVQPQIETIEEINKGITIETINKMYTEGENPFAVMYHGTSLYTLLEGMKMAHDKKGGGYRLLSRDIADKLGIPILSGEQSDGFASIGKSTVSITHSYARARGYADFYSVKNNLLSSDITTLLENKKKLEEELSKELKEKTPENSLLMRHLKGRINDITRAINYLNTIPENDLKRYKVILKIPLVLGIAPKQDPARFIHKSDYKETIITKYIDLSEVTHIYAPKQNLLDIKKFLIEIGFSEIKLFPIEFLDALYFSDNSNIKKIAKKFINKINYDTTSKNNILIHWDKENTILEINLPFNVMGSYTDAIRMSIIKIRETIYKNETDGNGFITQEKTPILHVSDKSEQIHIGNQNRVGLNRIIQWEKTNETYIPKSLLNFIKIELGYKEMYSKGVGVWEGFTLEEHTLSVMRNFEKFNFKEKLPNVKNLNLLPLLRLSLALHDIVKPKANEDGDKNRQHEYSIEIINNEMKQLGFKNDEINFVTALIMDDPIGNFLQNFISIDTAYAKIKKMAQYSELSLTDFFEILTIYYTVDAYAYPSLRVLFKKINNTLEPDKPEFNALKNKIYKHIFSITRNITKGFTPTEEKNLLKTIEKNSDIVRADNFEIVKIVKSRASKILSRKDEIHKTLSQEKITDKQIDAVISTLESPAKSFKWFNAIVESPKKYLLSHESALAVNLISHLTAWETTVNMPDIVDEYILHKALEKINMPSNDIMKFTSKFFNKSDSKKMEDSPYGKALEIFINNESVVGKYIANIPRKKVIPNEYFKQITAIPVLSKFLGEGANGVVFEGTLKNNKKAVVVKILSNLKVDSSGKILDIYFIEKLSAILNTLSNVGTPEEEIAPAFYGIANINGRFGYVTEKVDGVALAENYNNPDILRIISYLTLPSTPFFFIFFFHKIISYIIFFFNIFYFFYLKTYNYFFYKSLLYYYYLIFFLSLLSYF